MRNLLTFALATLAVSSLGLSNPVDTQIPLAEDGVDTQNAWTYTDCGTPDDVVQIKSIVLNPDPPEAGKDLTVKVIATANDVIEEGAYADVAVRLGRIKILTKTFDLCEEARKANASVQCPIEPGPYEVEHTVSLPKEIPFAKFDVDVLGYTANDDDMVCLKLVADFRPKFPFPGKLW